MKSACAKYRVHRVPLYVLLLKDGLREAMAASTASVLEVSGKLWKCLSKRFRSSSRSAWRPAISPMRLFQNDSGMVIVSLSIGTMVEIKDGALPLLPKTNDNILRDIVFVMIQIEDCFDYAAVILSQDTGSRLINERNEKFK